MPNKQAVQYAGQAVEADQAGKFSDAISLYIKAADLIEGDSPSPQDRQVAANYRKRAQELQSKSQAQQMKNMQASAQMASTGMAVAGQANEAVESAGGMKTMAATAAVGAAVGLAVAGPMVAVAGAGVAAYCTTRNDSVGDVARGTGAAAASTFDAAKKFNDEHNITGQAYDVAKASVAKAQEVDRQYKITEKVTEGVATAAAKAKELDEKHDITRKVGSAISSGLSSITKAMQSTTTDSSASSGSLPPVPK